MNTNFLEVRDTYTGEDYTFDSWKNMADFVIDSSRKCGEFARYLPSCNYRNLDYPERDETKPAYEKRLVDMAISLGLVA